MPEGKALVSPEHSGIRGTGVYGFRVFVCVSVSTVFPLYSLLFLLA